MDLLSTGALVAILIAVLAGAVAGAVAVMVRQRQLATKNQPDAPNASPRQEIPRYYLFNETSNVLIASSLSPSGALPEPTLAMFSEALAHFSAMFFAIAGTKDPTTGEPFSLYNYGVLKKALALHPVFIRVSTGQSTETASDVRRPQPILYSVQAPTSASPEQSAKNGIAGVEAHVKRSQSSLGLGETPEIADKLRTMHTQMFAEAERLKAKARVAPLLGLVSLDRSKALFGAEAGDGDKAQVGHITLYCECLMGISLVSVKLAHAHFQDYLNSEACDMETDIYLFVSPSRLRATLNDLNNLPHESIDLGG